MNHAEVLTAVEAILFNLSDAHSNVRGKAHYRYIKLSNGLELAIDIFASRTGSGHIRVHAYNIPEEIVKFIDITSAPFVPNTPSSLCPKCQDIPSFFPSWYKGPKANSNRAYYGFQWHELTAPTQETLNHIEEAAKWIQIQILQASAKNNNNL